MRMGEQHEHCGKPMMGLEYRWDHPDHWDGVSEWVCSACKVRIGRFTGRILTGDETETRDGRPQ